MKPRKWRVRKSRLHGDWWAHHPACLGLGTFFCILNGECTNCGKSLKAAYCYPAMKATRL